MQKQKHVIQLFLSSCSIKNIVLFDIVEGTQLVAGDTSIWRYYGIYFGRICSNKYNPVSFACYEDDCSSKFIKYRIGSYQHERWHVCALCEECWNKPKNKKVFSLPRLKKI